MIKGQIMTKELREKLSAAMKGKKPWNKGVSIYCGGKKFVKGQKVRLGKKHTQESKDKMSASLRGRKVWNKGLGVKTSLNDRARDSIEFRLWREAVFARDSWTCQKCGEKGGKLHPHHIVNFAENIELRFAIDNGVTLCELHHREFHKVYGQRKNNKEQIHEYIK